MSKQTHMKDDDQKEDDDKPYIKPGIRLPETTVKAFILGAILSAALAAANAYIGLFAGLTVSASIPAAVISMAVLKLFKNSNILENNIVQTAASAGESLAAGVIFTFPALVLMGYWSGFSYLETALIALAGGVLGVLFTIPLRNALIVKQKLKFPEGVATAEVLKSGAEGGNAIKYLAMGGLVGAFVKLSESGLKIWDAVFEKAAFAGEKAYGYFGLNLSPALMSVGYIVGLKIATLVFAGGVISWWIAIPIYLAINGHAEGLDSAALVTLGKEIWDTQIRFLGVGAMVVGGLWALINLRGAIGSALSAGLSAIKNKGTIEEPIRTEKDTPMQWVIMGIGIMVIPIFIIYLREIEDIPISGLMAIIMVIAGFLFASVAGYMAGLVGSSNNPISGVTIATILSSSLILLALLGTGSEKGPAAAILIGSVVACAAAIAGDNMQDLKAGNILGATPQKQQIMQMVGVVAAAFVMPLVLDLLYQAYGFGPATIDKPNSLQAPQATLMQSVAEGVFGGGLPWTMVYIGMGLGVIIIILDKFQEAKNAAWRFPVLAIAVGLYLPFALDCAIMLGGVIAFMVERYQHKKQLTDPAQHKAAKQSSERTGLLFASGLITGEALIGISIAFPIIYFKRDDFMAIMENTLGSLPGLVVIIAICIFLYLIASRAYKAEK